MDINVQAKAWADIRNSIGRRLAQGESYAKLARLLGVGTATVHGWVNGRVRGERIGFDKMRRYADKLGVDIQRYLVTEGESIPFEFIPKVEAFVGSNGSLQMKNLEADMVPCSKKMLQDVGVDPHFAFFIDMRDDSMEPVLPEGATVLVSTRETDRKPLSGQIVAVRLGDEVMVKRYENMGDRILLQCLNPKRPDRAVSQHQRVDWDVLGLVRWVAWAL